MMRFAYRNWEGPEEVSVLEASALSDLVAFANRLGETSRLTFYYSPILQNVEGIHHAGRKTFPRRVSLTVIRQWEQGHIIRLVQPGDKPLISRGSPSAVMAFVIPEDVLQDPHWRKQPKILTTINHLFRWVFPRI